MTVTTYDNRNQSRHEYWAKYDPDTGQMHRLEHHLADVGAVMESLLAIPSIKRATAIAGRIDELDPTTAARLAVFAALHDIGKTNLSFQAKRTRARGASHTKDMMQLLNGRDVENQERLMEAIQWLNDAMTQWDQNDGNTVCAFLIAMLSHHGRPENLLNDHAAHPEHWTRPSDTEIQQPFDKIREIATQTKQWFPTAFEVDAPRLPDNPEFQHHFLGLLMLADWIGSSTTWFPFQPEPNQQYIQIAHRNAAEALRKIGLDTREQPLPNRPATLSEIAGRPDAQPNAMQTAILKVDPTSPVVILESETGSGKTEAALLHYQRLKRQGLVDGMYFALPTRAAATQIHGRVVKAIAAIMPEAHIEPVLAIPGYIRAGHHDGTALGQYRVHWEDHPDEGSRWAAESSKRYLAAQVAVGTIDQAMLSVMQTKHAHLRAACLSRNLLIIDEVHASDTYMRGIIHALVRNHALKGGHTLMMSATLGSSARATYLEQQPPNLPEAKATHYPCISTRESITATGNNERQKEVHIKTLPAGRSSAVVAQEALKAQREGAKTLVIRNTVRTAIETAQALEAMVDDATEVMLTLNGKPTLHHSRFAAEDRKMLDAEVEEALGAGTHGRGIIIVGTQTLEQSLDIDADYLITDLCPTDVLLQRIGRLHRRPGTTRPDGYRVAQCMVLMPNEEIVTLTSKQVNNGLGPNGHVYQDLRVIEATKRQIESNNLWRIPDMNRALVEESTHAERLNEITDADAGAWHDHKIRMEGSANADRMQAENILARWDEPFYDGEAENNDAVLFKHNRAMTRLADPSIDVDFAPGTTGPFVSEITKISVPYWMIGAETADLKDVMATVIQNRNDKITFKVGDSRTLEYSRHGLMAHHS